MLLSAAQNKLNFLDASEHSDYFHLCCKHVLCIGIFSGRVDEKATGGQDSLLSKKIKCCSTH